MREANKDLFSRQVLQVLDAFLVLLSFLLAAFCWDAGLSDLAGTIANKFGLNFFANRSSPVVLLNLLFLAVPFTPLTLEMLGFYRSAGNQAFGKALFKLFQAQLLMLGVFAILSFALKFQLHRPTVVLGLLFGLLFLFVREKALNHWSYIRRKKGLNLTRLLLAGKGASCEEWWAEKKDELALSYKVVGQFDLTGKSVSELSEQLKETSAERAVFLVRDCPFDKVTAAMEECEIQGVEVWLSADFVRARIAQPSFDSFGGTPMLVLRSTPSFSWALLAKKIMDRVGAALLLALAAIPMTFVALGIKRSDPGPIFFKQLRAGKYGHPFYMWKFRTMVVDAEAKLKELREQSGNEMDGPVFKLDHDPRVFPFGRFLRKFSIDELPQLINVVRGEMSLVGPRPMATYELPDIEKSEHRRKLSVKPGITCIWQVSGRNEITKFEDWVKLDLQYIDNWSLWLDLKILLQTVPAVIFAKGAK